MPKKFYPGQRWSSRLEPELGLGVVLETAARNVKIAFQEANEVRVYRSESAPLQRVVFKAGDSLSDKTNRRITVCRILQRGPLFAYEGDNGLIEEEAIAGPVDINEPENRLVSGKFAHPKDYQLRISALEARCRYYSFPYRGLLGGRVQLIEHQCGLAEEISAQPRPRALLADEVGLGKTIEAGLILHRLLVTGRISRVLILVPHALIYQWLVELYRRFNQMFLIMDGKQFKSRITAEPEKNPFFNSQTVLSPIELFLSSKEALDRACESNWDHLIIDEAHHLEWRENDASAEYQAVARLAGKAEGLLLLTATPVQLGEEAHFGRLKLLDPVRFHSYRAYLRETASYRKTAMLCNDILSKNKPPSNLLIRVRNLFPKDPRLLESAASLHKSPSRVNREAFIQDLLDRHGTGRLVYRNRRSVIKGFPEKKLCEVRLSAPRKFRQRLSRLYTARKDRQYPLFFDPLDLTPSGLKLPPAEGKSLLQSLWQTDPRLLWLVNHIRQLPNGEKILVICSSPCKVLALQKFLPRLIKTAFTVFHEHLTLSTRDRNAADFSKPEGVKMMISSEIGSEGRNFQFARSLVLLDLPSNPALLEQRIGRIHRIGQTGTSLIYPLFIEDTPAQLLFRWYHEGLNSFSNCLPTGTPTCEYWFTRINPLARTLLKGIQPSPVLQEKFEDILQKTRAAAAHLALQAAKGRDRLLEIHSFQVNRARKMIDSVNRLENAPHLESFLKTVFDNYGVDFEQTVEKKGYFIFPGAGMVIDAFPELPESGLNITFDRTQALLREDMVFMTWDHPLVTGALDLILESSENKVCAVEWYKPPEQGLLTEFVFVLEIPPAPRQRLFGEMPPAVIKILLDRQQRERTDLAQTLDRAKLKTGAHKFIGQHGELNTALWPELLKTGRRLAADRAEKIKQTFQKTLLSKLESEKARFRALKDLQCGNTTLAEKNFFQIQMEMDKLLEYLGSSHIRLDAVRLVLMAQPG